MISKQIEEGLKGIDNHSAEKIIMAYEPVWAIGTGKHSAAGAQEVIGNYVRKTLTTCLGLVADRIRFCMVVP